MSNDMLPLNLVSLLIFISTVAFLIVIHSLLGNKRAITLNRLKGIKFSQVNLEEDVLRKNLLARTIGVFAQELIRFLNNKTPRKLMAEIERKLEKSGNKKNLKAVDFLAVQGILGVTVLIASWLLLTGLEYPQSLTLLLSLTLSALAVYLPWFTLARMATKLQREIKKSLPDIMDLLVISVEAGLGFDMAILKVTERFPGPIAVEFQKVLREMQLGKPRKDSLKDLAKRVDLPELTNFVNAVVQSEQLGVGLGNLLRLQSELIRDKRQQYIEEQAMKAPIKMLFPLVFFIFPCIFIIVLGPAILNIMKSFGN